MRGSKLTSQMKAVNLKHAWRTGGGQLKLRRQKVAARLSTPLRMKKRFRSHDWSPGKACPSALVNLRSLLTKDPPSSAGSHGLRNVSRWYSTWLFVCEVKSLTDHQT